jgi:formate dehydrogenase major subunit
MHEGPLREYKVKYRAPYAREWQELSLDDAMEMIVDRILKTREETWEDATPEGNPAKRTMGIANLGGATLDNEENYVIKKLMTALGVVQIENQARI